MHYPSRVQQHRGHFGLGLETISGLIVIEIMEMES
jgi:hypothetical protein